MKKVKATIYRTVVETAILKMDDKGEVVDYEVLDEQDCTDFEIKHIIETISEF
jgi:hypothetical protein